MISRNPVSRRAFLGAAAAAPLAFSVAQGKKKKIPVGLELFSVRNELAKDLTGTVRAVAKMGYEDVEFFAPYYRWNADQAKEVRKLMDDLNIQCLSTHNGPESFSPEGIAKAIELNKIIGAKYIVMASAGRVNGLDGWRKVAENLTVAMEKLRPEGLRAGYHNHAAEFKEVDGKMPIEVLAEGTPKDVMMQLDVGTCVEMGKDPVAWIIQNPGRINSLHCKDWSPEKDKGYQVLFAEGVAPWKKIFKTAEKTGGVEFYLIEQEGSRFPPFESAERCLQAFRKLHGA